MQEAEIEKKKSFWLVYLCVAIFYVAMGITYGVVVHKAALDGANNVDPNPDIKDDDNSNSAATKNMPDFTETAMQYAVEGDILQ